MGASFIFQCKFSTKKHYDKKFLIFFEFFLLCKIKSDNVSFIDVDFIIKVRYGFAMGSLRVVRMTNDEERCVAPLWRGLG